MHSARRLLPRALMLSIMMGYACLSTGFAQTPAKRAVAPKAAPTPPRTAAAAPAGLADLNAIPDGLQPRQGLDSRFVPGINDDKEFATIALLSALAAREKLLATRNPATAVAAQMMVGHVLTRIGEDVAAKEILDEAVKAAEKARWSDKKAHVALTHLAAIAARDNAPEAARLAARARACADPCADDAVIALFDAAARSQAKPEAEKEDAQSKLAAYRQHRRRLDAVTHLDPRWRAGLIDDVAEAISNDLPWAAIDLSREALAIMRAQGQDGEQLGNRYSGLAFQLRVAGEYRQSSEAAAEAVRLLPDRNSRLSFQATSLEIMGRVRLGEEGASEALDGLADRWLALPEQVADAGDGRDLVHDLIATKRWRKADEMLKTLIERKNHAMTGFLVYACSAQPMARMRIAFEENREADVPALVAQMRDLFERSDQSCKAEAPERAAMFAQLTAFAQSRARDPAVANALRAAIPDSARPMPGIRQIAASAEAAELRRAMTAFRDLGLVAGAAVFADTLMLYADEQVKNATYGDAQRLWQLAYTLALGGRGEAAFEVMTRAADIAYRHSIKDANSTDGGSLQLLKRDQWRYLLIVDIAWAISQGRAPEDLLVPSKY